MVSESPEPAKTGTPDAPLNPPFLELLLCPVTKCLLEYDPTAGELISRQAGLAFPIRNGIPILLTDEARKLHR